MAIKFLDVEIEDHYNGHVILQGLLFSYAFKPCDNLPQHCSNV
jgi:hypothetical protein